MQPNPWPAEMVLEYDNYKAADDSHGAASSRYRRERNRREEEVSTLTYTTGRQVRPFQSKSLLFSSKLGPPSNLGEQNSFTPR